MKPLVIYMLEVLACSGVLMGAYAILIERRVAFRWCRLYLLFATAAAGIIPLLRIPVWAGEVIVIPTLPDVAEAWIAPTVVTEATQPLITTEMICIAIYLLGGALILSTMIYQLLRIGALRRNAQITDMDGYRLVRTHKKIASFSFFGAIYIWRETAVEELPAILLHEASHIAHHHSAERVVMECLKAALWWNPFAWIAARRLTEVEEFEADSDVLNSGYDIETYMKTLFKQLFGYSPDIANGLRDSLTKKRFQMMTTKTNSRYALLRLTAVTTAVIGLLCAFGFTSHAAVYVSADEPQDGAKKVVMTTITTTSNTSSGTPQSASQAISINVNTDTITIPPAIQVRMAKVKDSSTSVKTQTVTMQDGTVSTFISYGITNTKPLYVVDGVVQKGDIQHIKHTDIASMSVIKDKSGVEKYGARAKDGVVEITTKQGIKKAGEITVAGYSTADKNAGKTNFEINLTPKEGKMVRISGIAEANSVPLFVVDGEVKDKSTMDIDPDNIASISVLKEGSAQALYGDRAQNGVIFITTQDMNNDFTSTFKGKTIVYIVDGKEVDNISKINSQDIASVNISKNKAQTAKYGDRAADGVVEIVTKQGDASVNAEPVTKIRIRNADDKSEPQTKTARQASDATEQPYLVAETMPKFQNGDLNTFRSWVQSQIKYPEAALNAGIHGRVVVSFTIETDGSINEITVLMTPGKSLSEEAMRVLASCPAGAWSPGLQDGKPVRVKYTLPVDFSATTPTPAAAK